MPNNFLYAASTYLDEWIATDRPLYQKLSFENEGVVSLEDGLKALVKFATDYGVIRTLRRDTKEQARLDLAYAALRAISRPTDIDVVEKVDLLIGELGAKYGGKSQPKSAASKFLWIRFRCPVVMYDSIAAGWLNKIAGYSDWHLFTYSGYFQCWRSQYQRHEEEIRDACAELNESKKFTLACDESDQQLSEWTSSRWFHERVFDHFMLNAERWNTGKA